MAETKKIIHPIENPFSGRTDGFIDTPRTFGKNIQETWVLKQVIKPTCDNPGEDDFVLDQKPFKLGEEDIDERMNEEAKGTDLKSLINMVIRTGDASILNQRQGVYIDVTDMPTDTLTAKNAIIQGKNVGGESFDTIGSMTKDEIDKYINDIVAKRLGNTQQQTVETVEKKEGE